MRTQARRRAATVLSALAFAAIGGILSLTLAVPAHADGSAVVEVNVPGQPTVIYGINQGLPALSASELYMAGGGLAPQIVAYQGAGAYQRDQAAVNRAATAYLTGYLKDHCDASARCDSRRRAAAVFDIDDTLLSTYDTYAANSFSPSTTVVQAVQESCGQTVIDSTKAFFNAAKARKVTLFLITGRSEAMRAATEACLSQIGITGYKGLIMHSPAQESLTAIAYKSAERAQIERRGYRIITAIGDQISDSAGGHTERGYLLPNPMYFIP